MVKNRGLGEFSARHILAIMESNPYKYRIWGEWDTTKVGDHINARATPFVEAYYNCIEHGFVPNQEQYLKEFITTFDLEKNSLLTSRASRNWPSLITEHHFYAMVRKKARTGFMILKNEQLDILAGIDIMATYRSMKYGALLAYINKKDFRIAKKERLQKRIDAGVVPNDYIVDDDKILDLTIVKGGHISPSSRWNTKAKFHHYFWDDAEYFITEIKNRVEQLRGPIG